MGRHIARIGISLVALAGLLGVGAGPASAATIRRSTRTYQFKGDCGGTDRDFTTIGTVTFTVNGANLTIRYNLFGAVPDDIYEVILYDTVSCTSIADLGPVFTNSHGAGGTTFSTSTPKSTLVFTDAYDGSDNDSTSVNLTNLKA